MFIKTFIIFIFFFNFFLSVNANERQLIINQLSMINNFTFNFEQITKEKIETGNVYSSSITSLDAATMIRCKKKL